VLLFAGFEANPSADDFSRFLISLSINGEKTVWIPKKWLTALPHDYQQV